KSSDPIDSHFMDRGAYVAFGQGSTALLAMRSIDCFGIQDGKGHVKWRAVVSLDALDPSVGKKAGFLSQADYIQIEFGPMPEVSEVIGGKVIITLNNSIRFEVRIGAQVTQDRRIFVRDLEPIRAGLQ
ncbi:MAG: hypothetical protein JO348_12435, partial [Alphaproteobacteria bacterium]|nr:hypothetical protein [Alphaproteobacteria bacterium]